MKRLILISTVLLAGLSLSACGNNNTQAARSSESSKESSLKAANASLKHRISQQKKQSKTNSSSIESSSSSFSDQQSANTSGSSSQSQASSTQTSNNQGSQNVDNFNGDIHDFINTYGETMAAYKIDHGMSVKDALNSTPDDMKTSGELQDQYMMNGEQ